MEEHDDVSKKCRRYQPEKKSHKQEFAWMGRKYLNLRSENVPELTEELLEKSGLKIADIDFFDFCIRRMKGL